MATVKPLDDRVLLKVQFAEEKTKGGIYIPPTAQEKTQEGLVVEVGNSDEIKVKAGDEVIYSKYAGTEIKIDGEEHLLIKFEEILAIIG